MVKCPDCGAGADLTADGSHAHCASCNNIFEPGKEGSGEKGSGSSSGDSKTSESQAQTKGSSTKDDGEEQSK
ncbi:hypothetical protein LTS08_001399 [Lithohypha guttulata]|uniref:Uncharacterized protein n=1 Tax=Lithohypha guttulata TaxID=1690604 RepID=A0AAN7SVC5_9EURO|nr:hypothetical protein LTR51_003935 [Lithohypha guttulata]KAK5082441.1 hypothetical protein LTR05_007588 [Lithohypha guttulata]KAK5105125.1 hypothetical protein LTS08_001399 [Lithohypha guttulata]